MLNITLDDETEKYLVEILSQEHLSQEQMSSSELIKQLLRDRWLTLQPRKTVLERLQEVEKSSGSSRHFLSGPSNLSDRDVRKKLISEHLQKKYQRDLQHERKQ